jgi:citrate lyase beta subunit
LTLIGGLIDSRGPVSNMIDNTRLRRSLLFVPGAEPRKIEGARSAAADTVIFDLEDAVAPERKVEARQLVADALRGGGFGGSELAVRINGLGTAWFADDVDAVVAAGAQAIVLPKVESVADLQQAEVVLTRAEDAAGVALPRRCKVLALIESARGITHAAVLGGATARIDALCFGHADFSLDMGLTSSDAQRGVALHARCALAIAAKACGVAPLDSVCLTVRDSAAFRADAELGLSLGYEGKLCIHPTQVQVCHEVYTPSPAQIDFAMRVVQAWDAARRGGLGVCTLDDKMIDAPVVAVHERVLARARRAGRI